MTEHSARYIPQATPREVANAAASALILGYSAPMPGSDSRYSDVTAAHEARLLGVPALAAALSGATTSPVGETVLEAVSGSLSVAGYADLRAVGYLAPLARAALLGERLGEILGGLSHTDALLFIRALQATGPKSFDQRLGRALDHALSAGQEATLRDAMRFAAAGTPGEPLAREYAQSYEITRELARPALLKALIRAGVPGGALRGAGPRRGPACRTQGGRRGLTDGERGPEERWRVLTAGFAGHNQPRWSPAFGRASRAHRHRDPRRRRGLSARLRARRRVPEPPRTSGSAGVNPFRRLGASVR